MVSPGESSTDLANGEHKHASVTADDFASGDGLRLDFENLHSSGGSGSDHEPHHHGTSDAKHAGGRSNNLPDGDSHPPSTMLDSSPSPGKRAKVVRRRKGPRAQSLEEVFATISSVRSSGLNPPQEHIVLTPRSAEACLRCGVNPETLKIRDLESFYDTDVSPAVQRMRHEAYSMRRHEEMKAVRVEKKKLVEAEDAAAGSPSSRHRQHHVSSSPPPPAGQYYHHHHGKMPHDKTTKAVHTTPEKPDLKLTLVEVEMKRLEKMKLRQERELEQMLDFEIKMSKIQQDASEKVDRERRLNEQRERERMRFAQEMAEEKRQREIKKKAQLDAEEERRKLVAAEMAQKDRELAEYKAKQERLRRIEAREREEERKAKAEEHRLVTEEVMRQQQLEIGERLKELDLAERSRNEIVEQQRIERARQMEDRRRVVTQRIRKNLKQSKKLELQRKRDLTRKQKASEQLRQDHEAEMDRQRELSRQQQEMMERKRLMVIEDARREEERKKEELLQRQHETDKNVHQLQETQQQQLELKKEYRRIQQQLKLDKVERMKRIQEYKRLETLRKMQETEQRTQAMLSEKDDLVRRRKQIAVHAKIQRDLIMRTMETVKITKKWDQASKTIEQVIGKTSPLPTKATSGRPKSSSGAMSRQTSLPNITRPHTPSAAGQSRVFRPPSPPPTRTAFKFTKEAQEEAAAAAGDGIGTGGGGGPQAYFSPYDQVPEQIRPKKHKNVCSSVF